MKTQHIVAEHKCKLCNSEQEQAAHDLYNEWCDPDRLARWFSIPVNDVVAHATHYGWDVSRAKDTTSFYRAIIRVGGDYFLKNPSKLRAETLAIAARQLDKIEGREQQARKNDADLLRDQNIIQNKIEDALREGMAPEKLEAMYIKIFPEFNQLVKETIKNGSKSKPRGTIH